jgi:hypothetical protein
MLFRHLLETLVKADVRFVVIDCVALVLALAPHHPHLRGAPSDLPFIWDAQTLRSGLNFTLKTDLGDLDVLGEVTGIGRYDAVAQLAADQEVAGLRLAVLSLDGLERARRAAGRVKDLLDLEEIAEIKRQSSG